MSVLEQLKTIQKKNDFNTEEFLKEVYKNLRETIINQEEIRQEEEKAAVIQKMLRRIKDFQNKEVPENNNEFQYIVDVMGENVAKSIINESSKLFNAQNNDSGNQLSSNELGEYLENGLSKIFQTIEKNIAPEEKELVKNVGAARTQVSDLIDLRTNIPDLSEEIKKITREKFRQLYYAVEKGISVSEAIKGNHVGRFFPSVSGKIDVYGLKANIDIKVDGDLNKETKDVLLYALKDATFTAKNYLSNNSLSLGQTNPFRVFATVAPMGGLETVNRYCRMYNCFNKHSTSSTHTEAPETFYRIRAIYELTGVGVRYVGQNSKGLNEIFQGKGAKFLILNNPQENIYVVPTSKIITGYFDDKKDILKDKDFKKALYGEIALPQTSVKDLASQP